MADFVCELTGCTLEQANEALRRHGGDEIWRAVDELMPKPACPGDKYLPSKPKINNGLTPEQEEICRKGRDLQDRVNVVFSVAHSKTRIQSDPQPEPSAQALEMPEQPTSATPEQTSAAPTQDSP